MNKLLTLILLTASPLLAQETAPAEKVEEKKAPEAVVEPAPAPETPAEAKKTTKAVKPYAHKSSKGKTYYLFGREQKLKNSDKSFTMYYFASDPENKKGTPQATVPADREVSETKTGLLVLKKKK